jgi:hypothetical protein
MRRAGIALAALALAVGAVFADITFFSSRDQGTAGQGAQAPGAADSTATDALLKAGNVEVVYGRGADGKRLRSLAESLGAPDTPALRKAGQALVVRRRTGLEGVIARAYRRRLVVATAADPRLQDFVEAWLGGSTFG